jgi:hypothetical protein
MANCITALPLARLMSYQSSAVCEWIHSAGNQQDAAVDQHAQPEPYAAETDATAHFRAESGEHLRDSQGFEKDGTEERRKQNRRDSLGRELDFGKKYDNQKAYNIALNTR